MRCHSRAWLFFGLVLVTGYGIAEPIPVRHSQTNIHDLFTLKNQAGDVIATGDHIESVKADRVESRLSFHFRDGSKDEETCVFTQREIFQLISDHHVQTGASFPRPLDLMVDVTAGRVTWRDWKRGKEESETAQMKLPDDLANGMIALMALNFSGERELRTSFLVLADGLRLVQLALRPDGAERAGQQRFRMHVEIGGLGGFLASVTRKQPPDFRFWVAEGKTPVFLKMEGPLYPGGPVWTMERVPVR